MSNITKTSPKSDEELDRLFKENHILTHSNRQNVKNKSFNDSFSDTSSLNIENLSKLDYHEVENDPKTPKLREEFKKNQLNVSLSPATPSQLPSQRSKPNLQKAIFKNKNLKNEFSAVSTSTPTSDDLNSNELLPDSEPQPQSPSKEQTTSQLAKAPASILKNSVKYFLDKETSQSLLKKHPELSNSMDSNNQLKTSKTARVLLSPKKNDTIHHYSYSPLLRSSPSVAPKIKNASPLTDVLNGNTKSNFKSPYTHQSSSSASSKRKSLSSRKQEEEWIDDKESNDESDNDTHDDTHEEEEEEENDEKEIINERDDKKRSKKKLKSKSWISLLFSFKFKSLIDPQLPYILSLYLQLIFNVLIVSILLYFVYSFISTVKADVENKVDSYASDIIQEISLCSREYFRNNCEPGKRVVALESACSQWEKCMNQDPTTVGRAKIGAETFAEIINGFIKPISWKSMTFLFLITVGSLVLTNAAFGTYRNYTQYDSSPYNSQQQQQQQHHHQQQHPSQTPINQTPFQTPYRTLQYDPGYTRFYTPMKPNSPTNAAIVRHRNRSAKKSSRR